jgi:hypothetical protein
MLQYRYPVYFKGLVRNGHRLHTLDSAFREESMLNRRFAEKSLRGLFPAALGMIWLLVPTSGMAQNPRGTPPAFIPAGYDDYQNMLDQLGIVKVRRGRDGGAQDTSNEATANRFSDSMPDLMTFADGNRVTSAEQWPRRRAEIVELFEREVYGRIPDNVPGIEWEVTQTTEGQSGGVPTITRKLVGHVDNSRFPEVLVDIQASFTIPESAAAPVPIIVQFDFGFDFPQRGNVPSWKQQALDHGWAYGTITPNSIQSDNNRLREGIIGLTNRGEPRAPDDWGALRAWAWGFSRMIDYFEENRDSGVDPQKVCITGVSRYGKAALVATAFDTRIAAGFVASSGAGGAKLFRRDFGELLENLASRGEYHWMAGNFLKYAAEEASFGTKTVADLPVDQHMLIALCAPRLCLVSYGIPERGDPNWVDAPGSFMAAVLAGPAYRLLGKKDLGTPGDYLTDPMPAVNTLIGGELAWRQHDGGHTNIPNFPTFFEWAGRYFSQAESSEGGDRSAPMIGAYYFDGWSGRSRWADDPNEPWAADAPTHLTRRMIEEFPEREPVWGWRDDSLEIMERQIDLAADHGLKFFAFCWYWHDNAAGINEDAIRKDPKHTGLELFLKAKNRDRMKFCLLIANHAGFEIRGRENWKRAGEFWLPYFQNEQYLKVDGKPLVLIFGAGGEHMEGFAAMQTLARESGLPGLAIAGCGRGSVAEGYTHRTHYNINGGYTAGAREVPYSELVSANSSAWSGSPEQPYIPIVTAGWDKRPWEGPQGLNQAQGWYYPDRTPEQFQDYLRDAVEWMNGHPNQTTAERIVLIYAWNEFGEGGFIAPTKGDPDGKYLEALKSVAQPGR